MSLPLRLLILFVVLSACGSTQPAATVGDDGCRSGYPDQASSLYVLPYEPGLAIVVGQGNCTDGSHEAGTDQEYAYDFDMPIGTAVVAARAGTVVVAVDGYAENNDTPGQENYLVIEHDDGSVAAYFHLTEDGVDVEVGDFVRAGDTVARSGNTGDSSEPHLHFEVARCEDCETFPVNFRNTREHTNGLFEGETYEAE